MGGADIKFNEWGIDVVFASSQKAFGVPPGLAMAAVSERVFEIAKNMLEMTDIAHVTTTPFRL